MHKSNVKDLKYLTIRSIRSPSLAADRKITQQIILAYAVGSTISGSPVALQGATWYPLSVLVPGRSNSFSGQQLVPSTLIYSPVARRASLKNL